MYDKKVFAQNLNNYISKNGLKRIDLCKVCNVSKAAVSGWCNGTLIPRIDKIETLAEYFGISKSDLLENKEDRQVELTDLQKQVVDYVLSLPEEKLEALYEFLRKM